MFKHSGKEVEDCDYDCHCALTITYSRLVVMHVTDLPVNSVTKMTKVANGRVKVLQLHH